MSEIKIENKDSELEKLHYKQRHQEVGNYFNKIKKYPLEAIHLRGEAMLPFNIRYHNDDNACIEIAVTGYNSSDIKADLQGGYLNVYTTYNHFGLKEETEFVERDHNWSLYRPEDFSNGVNRELFVHKGITAKPFNLKFFIPVDHTWCYASNKDGMLIFGFSTNQVTVPIQSITID